MGLWYAYIIKKGVTENVKLLPRNDWFCVAWFHTSQCHKGIKGKKKIFPQGITVEKRFPFPFVTLECEDLARARGDLVYHPGTFWFVRLVGQMTLKSNLYVVIYLSDLYWVTNICQWLTSVWGIISEPINKATPLRSCHSNSQRDRQQTNMSLVLGLGARKRNRDGEENSVKSEVVVCLDREIRDGLADKGTFEQRAWATQVWEEMSWERGQEVQRPEMGRSFAYSMASKRTERTSVRDEIRGHIRTPSFILSKMKCHWRVVSRRVICLTHTKIKTKNFWLSELIFLGFHVNIQRPVLGIWSTQAEHG